MRASGTASHLHHSPTVAVVIPVYNGGDDFRRCLESIHHSDVRPEELIVVADGGDDDSWRIAEAFGAQVFRLAHNGGPARARNVGGRAATSDILFFVDADVTVHPDAIARVKAKFQQHPDLTALIGSYDDEPGAPNFLSQYKNLFHHYTHQTASETASTFWGACGAVRRGVFLEINGFDETYLKPCVEDIELGYRLKQQGYAIRLCKDIQVKHLKHWQVVSLLRAEIFYRALPWTRLILQHRQFQADLNLDQSSRLSVVMVYLLVASLLASLWQAYWLVLAIVLMLGLLIANRHVYRFFWRRRGGLFMLQMIPWHWFYFFYGGAAFAYGTLTYQLEQIYRKYLAPGQAMRKSS